MHIITHTITESIVTQHLLVSKRLSVFGKTRITVSCRYYIPVTAQIVMTIVSQHIWKVIRFCMNFSQIFAGISLIEFNLMQFCFASTRIRSGYITQELTFCRKSEMPTKLNILRLFFHPRQLPRIYLIITIQNTSSALIAFRADSTTSHSHQSFHLR